MNVTTDPRVIEETRAHMRDVERLITATYSARKPYDQVPAVYPSRVNPRALWVSAHALGLEP